jgi:hypothetical protein
VLLGVLGLVSYLIRRPSIDEMPLLVLALISALGMILGAQINIGIRYLLPAYPPAIVLLSRCVGLRGFKPLALIFACALAAESVASAPRYHSFCNIVVRPWRNLVPDQDWGQSLIELRDWMQSNNQSRIGLLYFGSADPRAYDIDWEDPVDGTTSPYIAIARPFLDGLPVRGPRGFVFVRSWRRLRDVPPAADLGGLLIYRTSDVVRDSSEPWVVRIADWQQALAEPELLPLRNFERRQQQGD